MLIVNLSKMLNSEYYFLFNLKRQSFFNQTLIVNDHYINKSQEILTFCFDAAKKFAKKFSENFRKIFWEHLNQLKKNDPVN